MSLKDKLAGLVKVLRHSEAEETAVTPDGPEYCTPTVYEVTPDKGWVVLHYGPNRHERWLLEKKVNRFTPDERFKTREDLKTFLSTARSNFPIRKVILNDKQGYVFEPEFQQIKAHYLDMLKSGKAEVVGDTIVVKSPTPQESPTSEGTVSGSPTPDTQAAGSPTPAYA